MFKRSVLLVMLVCFLAITGKAQDGSVNNTSVNVSAVVPESFELTSWIRWAKPGQDPYEFGFSGDASAIDFGPLEWNGDLGIWQPTKYFTVFLLARSSGRSYQIKQTSTGLFSGTSNLNNSFTVTPDYVSDDEFSAGQPQGSIPAGDSYGTAGLAASGEKVVYDSGTGQSRIVRAYYGLSTGEPGKPGEAISGDYPAGTYSGSVSFTLTLK